jgi:agmatinase
MPTYQSLDQSVAALAAGTPPTADAGFLGSNLDPAEAHLLLLPVPWEATTSYGGGTSLAPAAIVAASHQLDLEDGALGQPYRAGIALLPAPGIIVDLNPPARAIAQQVIAALPSGEVAEEDLAAVNQASQQVNTTVYQIASHWLLHGKRVAVVGGDHSSPEGLIHALCDHHADGFGILHLDAHHDLRVAYEGFTDSHASIFYNVLNRYPQVTTLVQVAIRDYSRDEQRYAASQPERVKVFYGRDLFAVHAAGEPFASVADRIIAALPPKVYISFDIDALDPPYCPHTGTPVPGGLSFDAACYLLERLALSGRTIIGFDLCEVAPGEDEWDANVGARILYKLCGALIHADHALPLSN